MSKAQKVVCRRRKISWGAAPEVGAYWVKYAADQGYIDILINSQYLCAQL
jgi:hypothetical protein